MDEFSRARRAPSALLAGLLAVGMASVLLSACGSSVPGPPPASQGIVENQAVPTNVTLTNMDGQPTTLAAYRGKYVVLAPFLTLCQDECPLIAGAFLAMERDVAAAGLSHRVVFLTVSVDPWRDSPARLRAYQAKFGANWPMLTGSLATLRQFWSFFGVYFQQIPEESPPKLDWWTGQPLTMDVDHTDGFFLLDTQGHERFVDANAPNLGGKLSAKLKSLLDEGGIEDLDHPKGVTWTLAQALAALSWLVGQNIPSVAST